MTPSLWVASLIRNEADRFLGSALRVWSEFADELIVLDDCSEDGSDALARGAGAHVRRRWPGQRAWGTEAPARSELWRLAWTYAAPGDYILFLDADMIPARDPRVLMESGADSVFFALYDLWGSEIYREDGFWQGHLYPRLWMVKKRDLGDAWEWSDRGVHCGHTPLNYPLGTLAFAPRDFALLHYAYATPEFRREKHARYMSIAPQLSPEERAHAASIIDPRPTTFALPFKPEYTLS